MAGERLGIPRNLAVFVCESVFDGSSDILHVMREAGDWMFLCGGTHMGEKPRLVGIGHLLDPDPTLYDHLDMGPDEEAERAVRDGKWVRRQRPPLHGNG